MNLQVVIAPDSFKGSLPADRVAQEIASGWSAIRPGDTLSLLPQADGGEGTLDAVLRSVPGAQRRSAGLVTGPDGTPTPGEWVSLPDGTAVVELAQSSGLPLMAQPRPLTATTRGLGEVITAALLDGASTLWIGLGGSASTDGGAGALSALGLRLVDATGAAIPDGGAALRTLAAADTSAMLSPPVGGVLLLTDVTAPLLGPTGAAAVFGPQKGATAIEVALLEDALSRFAEVLSSTRGNADGSSGGSAGGGTELGGDPGRPGAGAAGGTGYGFSAVWGAAIRPGWEHLADLSGVRERVAHADVLVTGEGRFDSQSITGKTVGRLLDVARSGSPGSGRTPRSPGFGPTPRTALIAGQIHADPGCWNVSLTELAGSATEAMTDPAPYLRAAGSAAARAMTGEH
ncbi:MAG: glycerate kinase [Glaciihabitans sp.]